MPLRVSGLIAGRAAVHPFSAPPSPPPQGMFVPELVFGYLLTGSNFDDSTARLTGGRHGFGAKLTNIFSTEFTVECFDTRRGLRYVQVWTRARPPEFQRPCIARLTRPPPLP